MDKVTRQCPQATTFLKRKECRSGIEPRSFRLPLGQTGSRKAYLGQGEGGEGGMEVGEEGDYIPIATLSPPE